MLVVVVGLLAPTGAGATVEQPPGTTARVSLAPGGTPGNAASDLPALSADGAHVAFLSLASNLVDGDTNDEVDVFVHHRGGSLEVTRVSVASDGTQANGPSTAPAISADGRYVAFTSQASNLVVGDTNNASDVFVHDRDTGTTTRVDVTSDGTQANADSFEVAIGADGRLVAFDSQASNLVVGDTNNASDVFVHDRDTGETTRVSVASDGTQADAASDKPALSGDGRHVAFSSSAGDLAPGGADHVVGDPAVPVSDVFVHDRGTGATTRVSVASDGTPGNHHSGEPTLSADGRHVAFSSFAANLVEGDTNGQTDVFAHDRDTGATTRVSVASDGTQGDRASSGPALGADGRHVAFASPASTLVPDDTNDASDVFVHDRAAGLTFRVSVSSEGAQSDGDSFQPSMDADGRLVAFASDASNLLSDGDPTPHRDVYVRNRGPAGSCLDTAWEDLDRAPLADREAIPPAHRFNADCAVHHAIVAGFADGTYRPSLAVRRDQMATFVAGALDAADVALPPPTGERFDDVPAGSPHSDAIHRLAAAGLVQGGAGSLPETSYGPELSVRRDQMASFLLRAAELATDRTLAHPGQVFSDVTSSNAHFVNVNGAARHGLVEGFGDGTYRPAAGVRRDQTATFAIRLLGFDEPAAPPGCPQPGVPDRVLPATDWQATGDLFPHVNPEEWHVSAWCATEAVAQSLEADGWRVSSWSESRAAAVIVKFESGDDSVDAVEYDVQVIRSDRGWQVDPEQVARRGWCVRGVDETNSLRCV